MSGLSKHRLWYLCIGCVTEVYVQRVMVSRFAQLHVIIEGHVHCRESGEQVSRWAVTSAIAAERRCWMLDDSRACFHMAFTEEYGADVLNNIQVLVDCCVDLLCCISIIAIVWCLFCFTNLMNHRQHQSFSLSLIELTISQDRWNYIKLCFKIKHPVNQNRLQIVYPV